MALIIKNNSMQKVVKFEDLEQSQMNAINSCMADLFNYYETCGTPQDWKNLRIFQELITAEKN